MDRMEYEEMLDIGRKELPESALIKERFEVPKVKGHIQGNRTIINNFYNIANTFERPPEHLLKFVLKELATPGELKKTALLIGAKIPAQRINEKIQAYAFTYVICKECGKPDTKIDKEGNVEFIKCQACGAKYPVITK
jgi:translation initiation factor 2 subunit 2